MIDRVDRGGTGAGIYHASERSLAWRDENNLDTHILVQCPVLRGYQNSESEGLRVDMAEELAMVGRRARRPTGPNTARGYLN